MVMFDVWSFMGTLISNSLLCPLSRQVGSFDIEGKENNGRTGRATCFNGTSQFLLSGKLVQFSVSNPLEFDIHISRHEGKFVIDTHPRPRTTFYPGYRTFYPELHF